MSKKAFGVIIALVLVVGVGYYFIDQKQKKSKGSTSSQKNDDPLACYLITKDDPSEIEIDGSTYTLNQYPPSVQIEVSKAVLRDPAFVRKVAEEIAIRTYLQKKKTSDDIKIRLAKFEELVADQLDVTTKEIDAYYKTNKTSFDKLSEDQAKAGIKFHLIQVKRDVLLEEQRTKLDSLGFKYSISDQCPPKLILSDLAAVAVGAPKDKAKISLTFIGNFYCQECRDNWGRIENLLSSKLEVISLTPIIYTIGIGSNEYIMAKYNYCASKQVDSYFKYVASGFKMPLQDQNNTDQIIDYLSNKAAKENGLDLEKLKTCETTDEAKDYALKLAKFAQNLELNPRQNLVLINDKIYKINSKEQLAQDLLKLLE